MKQTFFLYLVEFNVTRFFSMHNWFFFLDFKILFIFLIITAVFKWKWWICLLNLPDRFLKQFKANYCVKKSKIFHINKNSKNIRYTYSILNAVQKNLKHGFGLVIFRSFVITQSKYFIMSISVVRTEFFQSCFLVVIKIYFTLLY